MKGAGKSVLMFTDGAAEILDSDSDAEDRADLLNDSQSDGSLLFVLRVSLFHDLLFDCVSVFLSVNDSASKVFFVFDRTGAGKGILGGA